MRHRFVLAVGLCALLGQPVLAQQQPTLVNIGTPATAVALAMPQLLPDSPSSPSQAALALQPSFDGKREAVFAIDLLLGMQTGVRSQLALARGDRHAFVAEAFYGALFHKLGASEGGGLGGRYLIRRDAADSNNSLILGPGFEVLFHFNRSDLVMLNPSIECAWLHGFGDRCGWEFGLNAGLGIGVAGGEHRGRTAAGRVTPLISVYSGFRF